MATEQRRWWFLIPTKSFDGWRTSISSVLDMLRYDHAVVESNAPAGYWLFSSKYEPTVARWNSFGIRILWVSTKASASQPDFPSGYDEVK